MTQINDPKLLPCPFCGEDAAIWYYPASERLNRKDSYYVGCTNDNCGCEMEHPGGWKTHEDAVNAWNRRAVTSELEKNSKKLEKDFGESDCISKKAVLDAIDTKAWEFCDYLISKGRNDEQKPVSHFADNLRECVREDLSSVTPQEPKTGHWIWCVGSHKCSNCEEYTCFSHKELLRYCPNCGAKMAESEDI